MAWEEIRRNATKALAFIRERSRAYKLAFSSPAGQEVLIDLAKFCRAQKSTFHPDARSHALLEGRREVWLRIINHMGYSAEQLFALSSEDPVYVITQEDENA